MFSYIKITLLKIRLQVILFAVLNIICISKYYLNIIFISFSTKLKTYVYVCIVQRIKDPTHFSRIVQM